MLRLKARSGQWARCSGGPLLARSGHGRLTTRMTDRSGAAIRSHRAAKQRRKDRGQCLCSRTRVEAGASPRAGRVGGRRINPERIGCHTGHRKAAGRCYQRHQTLQSHRLFRGGIGFVAKALIGEKFARHHETSPLARIRHVRTLPRVDRVDDRLLDAYGERGARGGSHAGLFQCGAAGTCATA